MKWLPHSIRWRIQLWHGLLLLVVIAGFCVASYRLQRSEIFRHSDAGLELRLKALTTALQRGAPREQNFPPGPLAQRRPPRLSQENPPDLPDTFRAAELTSLFDAKEPDPYYFVAWAHNGRFWGGSGIDESAVPRPARPSGGNLVGIVRTRGEFREMYLFTPPGECLLVGRSIKPIQGELDAVMLRLAVLGVGVLVFGLAGGWWLGNRAIRPIADISTAATRIASGHLSERIPTDDSGSELSQLARVLNDTFARLEATFSEQARFTSDAAHELRTPVSIILAQTQLALSRPRSAEDYLETIQTVRRSAERMQNLIESLLTLACLDADSEPLQRQPCDLAVLAAEHMDLIRPLAQERGIPIHSQFESAVCSADPDRIGQILTNLLTNAVKYSRPGDEIHLSTEQNNGHAIIRVSDSGPGIADEHLAHLFERFYRADTSRNRSTGGAGLGLAICRSLAEAHGGTINVESELEKGTTFTLRIPATFS